jgi:hypothetical protein
MSKELTAMQQLIEWASTELKLEGYEHEEIIKKATELLETEKQQIIDAYDESIIGYLNRNAGEFSEPKNGEKYYNQKYKP